MKSFPYNNSSLPLLACSTWYKNVHVLGCRSGPKNVNLSIGDVFHQMMKIVDDKIGAFELTTTHRPTKFGRLDPTIALNLATTAEQIYKNNPSWFTDCQREFFFDYQDPTTAARPSMTLDLMSYNHMLDCVDIRDYKTTKKPIDAKLITQYDLSSQRPFYIYHLYRAAVAGFLDDVLAPHYVEALHNLRVRFGYVFYNYETGQVIPPTLTFVDTRMINVFARIFEEKKQLAAAIHADPSLAVKEGMVYNLCWKCPFAYICAMHDSEKEEEALTKWPYGHAPYDPKHGDE